MSSLRKALVFFLLSALFAAKLERSCGHSLLQRSSSTSEFDCVLTPEELQPYSSREGLWVVTDSGLEALDRDVQSLVNCTGEGDVLLFDVERPVQPSRRITVPWNLTLSSFVDDPRMENGTFREADRKTIILCPREDEGVFLVEANDSLFANFVFRNCSLNRRRGEAPYGIFATVNCSTGQNLGTIAFHHLEFEANFLNRSAALYVQEPSCSGVQIIDVEFQENSCIGTCAASLPTWSEIQSITLRQNRFFEEDVSSPALISIHSGSNTTVDGLIASENNGTAVHVQNANLRISNSHIFQNSGGLRRNGDYTSGVTLLDSFGEILDSHFEENIGHTGSSIAAQNSSFIIRRTRVIGCNATSHGGGISITRSSIVRILDSVIANNSAGSDGGGVYSNGAGSLEIVNTTFVTNSAQRGGGIYGDDLALASLLSCHFVRNVASRSGGGALLDNGAYTIDSSIFEENASERLGGGFSCFHSILTVGDTWFLRNNATDNGGGSRVSGNTSAWFANCNWTSNIVSGNGGGVLFESVPNATITNSSFLSNQASSGGGAYATEATLRLFNVSGSSNTATRSGAVLLFIESNGTVSNCSFHQNTANFGGVLASYNSVTEVSVSNFLSNQASSNGGAIDSQGSSNLTIEDCSFDSNSANGYGGAISVPESMVSATYLRFQNNSVSDFGGAVSLRENATALFSHSQFFGELSGVRGGAISATEVVLRLRNISIASCSAVSGGGIYFYRSLAYINDTSVTRCEASELGGGGIHMIESEVTSHRLNISWNTAMEHSGQNSYGGGIAIERSSSLSARDAFLDGNMAQYGAGISARGDCIVNISNGRFYNNSAMTSGGVAFLRSSSSTIERVSCIGNSAFYGGSIYAFDSSLTLNDSQQINSSSTDAGGSMLAEGGSTVVMEGTTIQSSRAVNGGGIMLRGSYFWGIRVEFRNCSARAQGGGVGLNESSSFLCTDCLFEGNIALHEGGAMRVESLDPQLLAFQLENTVFQDNAAAFGGGIHFQTGDGTANCSSVNSTECTFLALTGCAFTSNNASFAGGAILANNPNAIRLGCHPFNKADPFAYYTREELGTLNELSSVNVVCDSWMGNTASTYGPIVGSYARRLSKTILLGPNRTVEISGNRYVLRNHQSGVPLPTISLEAIDEFGQGPALNQGNQLIEAVMTSPDGLFAGIFIVRMRESRGNFSGITGFNEPGNYDIHIDFNESSIPTLIIVVEIRQCIIGESRAGNGTLCEPCGDNMYNFHRLSSDECAPCPDDARCDSVAIRPKKGFWHQAPCSSHVQRCLSERACDEEERDTRLLALGSNIEDCDFDDEFIGNYSEALCREGYTGPLSGSCNASFGKSRSFRCEECYGRFVNLFLVLFVASILLGLTAFTVRSALPAHRHPASRGQSGREGSPSSPTVNVQMVEMWCTGVVPRELIYPHLRRQETNTNAPLASQQRQRNAELAKWKAVEIFKITINYLQVIAIAIAVNVAWTGALIALFETAEFIGGMTSEASGRSIDCLISADSSIPRSAVTTIVNLTIPAVVAAIFAIFWAAAMIKKQEGYGYLVKRCLLSALVVNCLSYIAITKTAVNILYCVEVHDSVDFENDSTTMYWAVDTALKCYEGPHTVLASVFGWPVLIVFSLGFPVLIAYVLITKRSQEGVQNAWIFETAGFLYRSYDSKFIFWESVILLRKASLAAIVVFAYPLGGNLQGLLAVCVLSIASYFHLLCRPYRSEFETLNQLEGLSLLISSLTFVSGLFFNDDRTSPEARTTIAVFIVLANVGIFIFFSVRFFVAGATYLGIVLENEGVVYDHNAPAFHIVKTFVKNRFDVHLGPALRRFNVFTYRHHEESIPSGV